MTGKGEGDSPAPWDLQMDTAQQRKCNLLEGGFDLASESCMV